MSSQHWCPFSPDEAKCDEWCKLYRNGSCAIMRMAEALEQIAKRK